MKQQNRKQCDQDRAIRLQKVNLMLTAYETPPLFYVRTHFYVKIDTMITNVWDRVTCHFVNERKLSTKSRKESIPAGD